MHNFFHRLKNTLLFTGILVSFQFPSVTSSFGGHKQALPQTIYRRKDIAIWLQLCLNFDALPFGDKKNMQKFLHRLKNTLLFIGILVSFQFPSVGGNKQALTWEIHCQKHIEIWSLVTHFHFAIKKMQKFSHILKIMIQYLPASFGSGSVAIMGKIIYRLTQRSCGFSST